MTTNVVPLKTTAVAKEVAHSLFGPSSSERWITCPGSVMLTKGMPDTSSDFAGEGSAAHFLADRCLHPDTQEKFRDPFAWVGTVFPRWPKWPVTKEMAGFIQQYLDYVAEISVGAMKTFPETKVDLQHIAADQFGTVDFSAVFPRRLKIVDLKYGKGVKVYAAENPQLSLYADGQIEAFDYLMDFETVEIHVFQPRLDHIDVWETTPKALAPFRQKAKDAIAEALGPNPRFQPSEAGCQWCKAKATCKPRAEFNLKIAQADFDVDNAADGDSTDPDRFVSPAMLTNEQIGGLLRHTDQIKKWVKAVEDYAALEIGHGRPVPGWKLVEGKSNRRWSDEDKVASYLIAVEGLDDTEIYNRKLIGITDAEKLVGKKNALFDQSKGLVVKPNGSPTLAPESDKRPALTLDAKADFAGESPEATEDY